MVNKIIIGKMARKGWLFAIAVICMHPLCCSSPKKSHAINELTKYSTKWILEFAGVGDERVNFYQDSLNCFIMWFSDKNFKNYDGYFYVKGNTTDTNSAFYTSTHFHGLYHINSQDFISMNWFSKTSVLQQFSRNDLTKALASRLRLSGVSKIDKDYAYIFSDGRKMDTVLQLKRY